MAGIVNDDVVVCERCHFDLTMRDPVRAVLGLPSAWVTRAGQEFCNGDRGIERHAPLVRKAPPIGQGAKALEVWLSA